MGIGQVIGVVGVTGSAATALGAALLRQRASQLESGRFVREALAAHGIPDIWAQHIASRGRFQRGWGMRTTSQGQRRPHGAVDICGPQGSIIHAMRSGVVEHSGQLNGYGEAILLRHPDGSTSLYAHMNERGVEQGAIVQGGSPIGIMGRTSTNGQKPNNPQNQGSPRVVRQNPIQTEDPRCSQFPNMGVHTHFSIHGASGEKLPHSSRFNRTISSDKEWRYGTDPQQYLGAHGVRLAASSINACPQWSPTWSIA